MIVVDGEKTDEKSEKELSEAMGALGDGWDLRSTEKEHILTGSQRWMSQVSVTREIRVYKASRETLQTKAGKRTGGKIILQVGCSSLGEQWR
jgi:hypothetical protein